MKALCKNTSPNRLVQNKPQEASPPSLYYVLLLSQPYKVHGEARSNLHFLDYLSSAGGNTVSGKGSKQMSSFHKSCDYVGPCPCL